MLIVQSPLSRTNYLVREAKSADGRVTRPVVLGFPLSCRFLISPGGEALGYGGNRRIKTPPNKNVAPQGETHVNLH
jgi:hypothetical protein